MCQIVGLLGVFVIGMDILPLQMMDNKQVNTIVKAETGTEFLQPIMVRQKNGEEIIGTEVGYQPNVYLNVPFGQGANANLTKDINLPISGGNNVELESVPDAYKFQKIVVQSDDENGHSYMKEVTKVIKVGNVYYGLIKDEAGKNKQDYLKFTNPHQLKIVYDRYLRVGFKKTLTTNYTYVNPSGILADITKATSATLDETQREKGFYLEDANYVDQRMYYLPDNQPLRFSRPGFKEISWKKGSETDHEAMQSSANFYSFTNRTQTQFFENLNGYSFYASTGNIDADYLIKKSGIVSLDYGIAASDPTTTRFKLRLPKDSQTLGMPNDFVDEHLAAQSAAKGAARITWGLAEGKEVDPSVDRVDYNISKGGMATFIVQNNFESNRTFTHLNKLVINGQTINLPPAQLRPQANQVIAQSFSPTAYTYLKTGELVAVSFVPIGDTLTPHITPWSNQSQLSFERPPYYYLTIMNVQGDIQILDSGAPYSDGRRNTGANIVFLRDGHGLFYHQSWWGITKPYKTLTWNGENPIYDAVDVATVLQFDHDLDVDNAQIYSGSTIWTPKEFPHGYFLEGENTTGIGVNKGRRLIVDSAHPVEYTLDFSSRSDESRMNDKSGNWLGRYYDRVRLKDLRTNMLQGSTENSYLLKPDKYSPDVWWIDLPHIGSYSSRNTSAYAYGVGLYRVNLINKYLKTMTVQYLEADGTTKATQGNLVFPRSDASLIASLDVNNLGKVASLQSSSEVIGKTSSGFDVKKSDEAGFITIPELPAGASYYKLLEVNTNSISIPLTEKRFAPGQKVFLGQFLPEGKSFGEISGIDDGSVVTLQAVVEKTFDDQMTEYNNLHNKTQNPEGIANAQVATPDMEVKDQLAKYVKDTVAYTDLVTNEGAKTPTSTFEVVNTHDMSNPTSVDPYEPATVFTLKNFADSSYEILPTELTVYPLPKANLQVTDQTRPDPRVTNKDGIFTEAVELATTATSGSTIAMTQQSVEKVPPTGMQPPISTTTAGGTVTKALIERSSWGDADNETIKVKYQAQASAGTEIREKSRRTRRALNAAPPPPQPAPGTSASDPKEVTLTITKAETPALTIEAESGKEKIVVSFAKQADAYTSGNLKPEDFGAILEVVTDGAALNVTNKSYVLDGDKVTAELTLDRPLKDGEKLTFTSRYNLRFRRLEQEHTVRTNIEEIINTGIKLLSQPSVLILLTLAAGVGGYYIFKRRNRIE